MLLNYHIRRLVLSSLCVEDLVRLALGGVRFAAKNDIPQTAKLETIKLDEVNGM